MPTPCGILSRTAGLRIPFQNRVSIVNFTQRLYDRMNELCAHLGHGMGGWAKPNPLFDDGDRSSNESGDDEFVGVEDQDDFHGYAGKNVINDA